jgi:hypothetical protein
MIPMMITSASKAPHTRLDWKGLDGCVIQLGRTKFNPEGEHEFSVLSRRNSPLLQSRLQCSLQYSTSRYHIVLIGAVVG